jgi:hypothetical protein
MQPSPPRLSSASSRRTVERTHSEASPGAPARWCNSGGISESSESEEAWSSLNAPHTMRVVASLSGPALRTMGTGPIARGSEESGAAARVGVSASAWGCP